MDKNNEQNVPNSKLIIWFCGTTESKNLAKSNLKSLKSNNPNIKAVVIDGVSTIKNRAESNKMRNDKGVDGLIRKIGNKIGNPVGIAKDIFDGYEEATHLVQLEKASRAINSHIEENPNTKTDLVIGGFSRGAAVALPAFLGSLAEASKSRSSGQKEQVEGNNLFKEHFEKISVIAVDPVPGINEQDTFGLDTLKNQENPLKEIFETLNTELEKPIDITYMPSNYDMLAGLTGCKKWNALANDTPDGVELKTRQAGTDHLSMTLLISDHRYEKGATPRNLLNRVIQEKLETVPEGAMPLDEIQRKVTDRDSRILTDMATGRKIPRMSEAIASTARGVVRSLHFLGGPQGKIVDLKAELKKQLENPDSSKIIGGRSLEVEKLGLELNAKGKLEKMTIPLSKAIKEAKEALAQAEKAAKGTQRKKGNIQKTV